MNGKEAAKAAYGMENKISKNKTEGGVPMIQIEGLTKRYGSLCALDGLTLEIGRGEVIGLLGPNGAGKSTAMNILTGYLSATSGRALIDGIDIFEDPKEAKKKIGYLPEQPPLYPDMTVEEYLNFTYDLKGCALDRAAHLEDIMRATRIYEVRGRLIRNLSKGYKQRVGMAQALVGDPPVLIFDEPTVGLDPKQIIEIRSLLRSLGKRHTVILSTHILSEVQAVCERVVILDHGHLLVNERTEILSQTLTDRPRYRYIIDGNKKEVLSALREGAGIAKADAFASGGPDGEEILIEGDRGVDVRRAVFRICAKHGWPILSLQGVGMDIEDIFLRLVDRDEKTKK